MKACCVPGCKSRSTKRTPNLQFFSIPTETSNGFINHAKKRRRTEWLKAINPTAVSEATLRNARVCSNHFVSGRPAPNGAVFHVDWVPSLQIPPKPVIMEYIQDNSVVNIIMNLPEVTEEFDVPEYVFLDKYVFNERQIELDLVQKYITSPICDDNGYYRNDHDYLGLPIIRKKTQKTDLVDAHFVDHNYSTNERPACLYTDLRHFCNICHCNNRNLFAFNKHMMIHTVRNDVTCSICSQKFLTTTCLNSHMLVHITICDICGSEVPTVQLHAHQQAVKLQKRKISALEGYRVLATEKTNFCIFCMKEFANRTAYLGHLASHRIVNVINQGARSGESPEVQVVQKSGQGYLGT